MLDPVVWLLRNNSRMPLNETVCPYVPSAFIFLLLAFLLCIVNDLHILIKLNSVRLDSTFFFPASSTLVLASKVLDGLKTLFPSVHIIYGREGFTLL